MTPRIDALFRLDAGPGVGFGHAARCLKLAHRVAAAGGLSAFEGNFTDHARRHIAAAMPSVTIERPGEAGPARVGIVDLMTRPEDPEAWDPDVVNSIRARARSTIFIASGLTAPSLPFDVNCIGYQPVDPSPSGARVDWGLAYAPVDGDDVAGVVAAPEAGRVLVALGGAPDATGIESVLAALREDPTTRRIDVLLSPAGPQAITPSTRPGQTVETHRAVASVFPLLARAEIVIASFGNLCYEALHLGAALVVLGQKRFQVECAALLARRGLAASAGFADSGLVERLPPALASLRHDMDGFRQRARTAIDGRGIARIADRILKLSALPTRCASPA